MTFLDTIRQRQKGPLIIFPILLITLILTPVSTFGEYESGYIPYVGDNFRVQYPSDWIINDTGMNQHCHKQICYAKQIFQSPNNEARVSIGGFYPAPPNILDKDAWTGNQTHNNSTQIVNMISNSSQYMSNHPALIFSTTNTVTGLKEFNAICVVNDAVWVLEYSAYQNKYSFYLDDAQKMLETFHAGGSDG